MTVVPRIALTSPASILGVDRVHVTVVGTWYMNAGRVAVGSSVGYSIVIATAIVGSVVSSVVLLMVTIASMAVGVAHSRRSGAIIPWYCYVAVIVETPVFIVGW